MSRVIHFEIPADNAERAIKFYGEVFGWQFQKWEGPQEYWLIKTGQDDQPGINGGLVRRQQPGGGTVNTIGVESVDKFVAAVENKGGKKAVPKMVIPGVGYVAYCTDPEGNTFGIFETDQAAC
jgi:predicted enzyme related to lactoylglutathione lyase